MDAPPAAGAMAPNREVAAMPAVRDGPDEAIKSHLKEIFNGLQIQ